MQGRERGSEMLNGVEGWHKFYELTDGPQANALYTFHQTKYGVFISPPSLEFQIDVYEVAIEQSNTRLSGDRKTV